MDDIGVGRVIRRLRHRRDWRQRDLAQRAGVRQQEVSDAELGRLGRMRLDRLRAISAALDLWLPLAPRWRGGDLDRLLDRDHAALQELWKRRLERLGWLVAPEVSFNFYGDRGSIDLLAFDVASATLLVIEIKTELVDLQELLRGLDVKRRWSPRIAKEHGWQVRAVVPMLVLRETTTTRRRVAEHAALFASFAVRGRAALAWLRRRAPVGGALLVFTNLPSTAPNGVRRAGPRRIRCSPRSLSVNPDAGGPQTGGKAS